MEPQEIIDVIKNFSLTVRCLPLEVVSYSTYREGDEERCKKPTYDANGNIRNVEKNVVTLANGRKFLKEVRQVNNGGWWYVKETPDTNSTVRFSRKHDKFFAPTLEEAIQLYLNQS